MTLINPHTQAYTDVVGWSRDVPKSRLTTEASRSFIAEELVDRFSLEVRNLDSQEWKQLHSELLFYLNVVCA